MDIMDNKNSLSDSDFETLIHPKLISKIKSFSKFQELDKIATEKGFQVVFMYFKEETKREIAFEVGFGICDKNGKIISVPLTAHIKYYDLLDLSSYAYGACYNKRTKKLDLVEDDEELYDDCSTFIDFLKDEC